MNINFLLGFIASIPFALCLVWHGQQMVNPLAQLLFWSETATEAVSK
ncbi:MAG: hypothetical protein KGO47_07295 [Cyanobacteria bacterium REEB417]|nr:hypothetical protein [Cyanobacteria bacterium REEB417]